MKSKGLKAADFMMTGADGFIGSHLAAAIFRQPGKRIVLLTRNQYDFSSGKPFETSLKSVGVLLHLASLVPLANRQIRAEDYFKTNVLGTYYFLKGLTAVKIKKFICLSSSAVYGANGQVKEFDEQAPVFSASAYGASKLLQEKVVSEFCRLKNIELTILRLPSVYGYGQNPGTLIPVFLSRAIKGMKLPVWGRGRRKQDFIYIAELVHLILKIASSYKGEGVFNIGPKRHVSTRELAAIIYRSCGLSPVHLVFKTALKEEEGVLLDSSKSRRAFGNYMKYSLEQGIRDYISKME